MGRTNGVAVKKTSETRRIETILGERFSNVEAYRYNSTSIRVRVIDEAFRKLSKTKREDIVQPLLDSLPEKTQADIMILLLLTPEETDASLMNLEFEHPTPSQL
jgi:hypothetical protein